MNACRDGTRLPASVSEQANRPPMDPHRIDGDAPIQDRLGPVRNRGGDGEVEFSHRRRIAHGPPFFLIGAS